MHFTAALTYKSVCKTCLIASYSHDKGKYSVAVFVDFHYNHFDIPGAVHIIWSDGPFLEFKNIHCKVPSITQSEAQDFSHRNVLLQTMGKELLMELVANLRL